MRRPKHVAPWLALLTAGTAIGCALTNKAEMLGTRYFEPEPPRVVVPLDAAAASAQAPRELQLGRVSASAYLRRRLVYRTSSFELGAYEDRQWAERPEEYLRRAVSSALFAAHGITQAVSGDAPTLDVELAAFEEIRVGDRLAGRVTIRFVLHDDHAVWMTDSVSVDRATRGGSQEPEDVVAAISSALGAATDALAKKVDSRLRAPSNEALASTNGTRPAPSSLVLTAPSAAR